MTVTKHSEGHDRGGWPEPGAGEVSVEKSRRDAGRKTGDGELQKGQQRSSEPAGETTQTQCHFWAEGQEVRLENAWPRISQMRNASLSFRF